MFSTTNPVPLVPGFFSDLSIGMQRKFRVDHQSELAATEVRVKTHHRMDHPDHK